MELLLWFLFLVPGLLYSHWRHTSRKETCQQCGGTDLVPAHSPVGRQILAAQHATGIASPPPLGAMSAGATPPPPLTTRSAESPTTSIGRTIVLWAVGVFFLFAGFGALLAGVPVQAILLVAAGAIITPAGWRALAARASVFQRGGRTLRAGIPITLLVLSVVIGTAAVPSTSSRLSNSTAPSKSTVPSKSIEHRTPTAERTAATGPNTKSDVRSTSKPTLPADLSYRILEQTLTPPIKQSFDVELSRRATEDELRVLADIIGENRRSFERTFILYYMPGQKLDAGAWASSHFNPNLEIRIMGFTDEQEAQATKKASSTASGGGSILGRWQSEFPPCVYTIQESGGQTFLVQAFNDGSGSRHVLRTGTSNRGRRFDDTESRFEEFYVINSDGDLEIWDSDGLIDTVRAK